MHSLSKSVCRFRLFQATRLRGCHIDEKSTATRQFSWTRKIAEKISEDGDGARGNTKMTKSLMLDMKPCILVHT